ncbi:MAG: glycosyltransferase, partial [Actinomycetota bacterium]
SGFVAECLSANHDVELLAHEPLDRSLLKERLDVDLSRVGIRLIPEEDDVAFGHESSKYDLLVNTTFGSDAMCRARYGLYICHFPVPHAPIKTGLAALAARVRPGKPARPHTHIEWGDGWFGHERAKDVYRWSTEQPNLRIWTPKGTTTPVRLIFLRALPQGAAPTELDMSIEGEVIKKVRIEPGHGSVRVDIPIRGKGLHPTTVQLNCNTFRPHEQFGSLDPRHLGVALVADQSGRPANGFTYSRRRYAHGPQLHFLDSYDQIVSNSQYTQMWMSRLWNRESLVINPPVSLQTRAEKDPIILSVGRFFDDTGGHCKKQAEMMIAFRALVDRGLKGWSYHLVGGCEKRDMPYLEHVRQLAKGLPVEIHVGATGAELKSLYSRASIFWHATGLGEDERAFPARFEHFGITTVEAMSAGAVPIVIGKAGQLETLVDGVHGRHFQTIDELADHTWELVHDDELRTRFSSAAEERAKQFGPEVARHKIDKVVEEILSR